MNGNHDDGKEMKDQEIVHTFTNTYEKGAEQESNNRTSHIVGFYLQGRAACFAILSFRKIIHHQKNVEKSY